MNVGVFVGRKTIILLKMKKIGIFYGSSTGTTERVAYELADALGVDVGDVYDVARTSPDALGEYDVLLLGTSTWGVGEIQDDWRDFMSGAQVLDLSVKMFGVFGCGDETMADTFCSGMGELYNDFVKTGARLIGEFNADGYEFEHSGAEVGDVFVGLVLDEVNRPELSHGRIREWSKKILYQIM